MPGVTAFSWSPSGIRHSGVLALVLAGICFGTVPFVVQLLSDGGTSLFDQVRFRLVCAAVFLLLFPVRSVSGRPSACGHLLAGTNGIFLVLSFTTYLAAIAGGTPPARAIALVYLYPVWLALISFSAFGERLTPVKIFAVALGVLGAALTTRFWAAFGPLNPGGVGDILALVNGVILAAMVTAGRFARSLFATPMRFARWSFGYATALVAAFSAVLTIFPLHRWTGMSALTFRITVSEVALLCVLGVVGTALPYVLLYFGATRVQSTDSGVWLLSEPCTVAAITAVTRPYDLSSFSIAGTVLIVAAGAVLAWSSD